MKKTTSKKPPRPAPTPAKRKKATTSRKDAAGRSGMGETASSNIAFKKGAAISSAQSTAMAAAVKAKKKGKNPRAAYANNLMDSYTYAGKRAARTK